MKTKIFRFANRMVVAMLTCMFTIGLTSCGDDEPSVDELLSEETTPITFDLGEKGTHFLFDYAGNNYVGADTINVGWDGKAELNLRRGKHHLLWITGLSEEEYGVHFDPIAKEIKYRTSYGSYVHFSEPIDYAQLDIDVNEYLRPAQQLEYTSIMSRISIDVEDSSPLVDVVLNQWNTLIGKASGFPVVSSVSLFGKSYSLEEPSSTNIYSYPFNKERQTILRPGELPSMVSVVAIWNTFCVPLTVLITFNS